MLNNTVLAIDIGGSKVLTGLVTKDGQIIDCIRSDLPKQYARDDLEDRLIHSGKTLIARNRECSVYAVGVTIPGLADQKTGIWVNAVFSGICDYPIARRLGTEFNLPVYIENDVNACAWAEKIYGKCKDINDFLWVTISNGSGGGLILNGNIYYGFNSGAGEVGHLIVDDTPTAAICPCGHRGCLESMVAGPGIVRRYRGLVQNTNEDIEARDIIMSARKNDRNAVRIVQETGFYIGKALAMCANILNLPCHILGGGIMQDFELFEPAIISAFKQYAFSVPNQNINIVQTGLGYEAGLKGAAAIAWYPAGRGI